MAAHATTITRIPSRASTSDVVVGIRSSFGGIARPRLQSSRWAVLHPQPPVAGSGDHLSASGVHSTSRRAHRQYSVSKPSRIGEGGTSPQTSPPSAESTLNLSPFGDLCRLRRGEECRPLALGKGGGAGSCPPLPLGEGWGEGGGRRGPRNLAEARPPSYARVFVGGHHKPLPLWGRLREGRAGASTLNLSAIGGERLRRPPRLTPATP